MTRFGCSAPGSGVTHGALAFCNRWRRLRATDHRGLVRVDHAVHRVGDEEPGDEEHLVVLGELDARGLRVLGSGRVDRHDVGHELAPVDAARRR